MITIAERVAAASTEQAQVIGDALDTFEDISCQFWACDGPDVEPTDMKTCRVCWTLWDLRKAGILTAPAVTP